MARLRRRVVTLAIVAAVLALLAGGAVLLVLQDQGITPRALAPYVAKRSSGHNNVIVGTGKWSAELLQRLDRGEQFPREVRLAGIGAQPDGPAAEGTVRMVGSADELRRAMATAAPGDSITLLPGSYRISGPPMVASRPGTGAAAIVVRAAQPGSVELLLHMTEGFVVMAPYWRFENLTIRGVCTNNASCEHAFHVSGAGSHFAALNNTIVDFNAHFKVNGLGKRFPDNGRIHNNTIRNDSVRNTGKPVTPVDIVAASGWSIRRNAISDFVKGGGDLISYGGFAKGAGSATVFEHNLVVCEARLRGRPGQRVGLSLGGGGSGKQYCRDQRCITEQDQGVIRANIIASCSDEAIYLNNAAGSQVIHNTLVDTGGIQVRHAGSSADIEGNIIDGAVRARNGAIVRLNDNLTTAIAVQYLGVHPQRRLFSDPDTLDLRWRGEAPRREGAAAAGPDLCGAPRPAAPAYGAFEDISACVARDAK